MRERADDVSMHIGMWLGFLNMVRLKQRKEKLPDASTEAQFAVNSLRFSYVL